MVYYFTSNVVDPPATIYVGKDKFESLFLSFLFTLFFSFFFGNIPIHPKCKDLSCCIVVLDWAFGSSGWLGGKSKKSPWAGLFYYMFYFIICFVLLYVLFY